MKNWKSLHFFPMFMFVVEMNISISVEFIHGFFSPLLLHMFQIISFVSVLPEFSLWTWLIDELELTLRYDEGMSHGVILRIEPKIYMGLLEKYIEILPTWTYECVNSIGFMHGITPVLNLQHC